jgi:cell division protein FtsW
MKKGSIDYTILFVTLVLTALGVVMVYSASFYASGLQGDSAFYFRRQLAWAGIGTALMLIASRIDYRIYGRRPFPFIFLILGFALLIGVLIFGSDINNTKRWFIIFGVSVQPAEIAKLCLILFMSASLSQNKNVKSFWYGVLPYLVLAAGYAGLVFLQPNFSTTVTIMLIAVSMLVAAGVKIWQLGLMGVAGAGVAAALLLKTDDYRLERIETFLDPFADPSGSGYQVIQSLYSLGAGGLFGLGLGQSRQKFLYLPYRESDFVFAIIGEELGFIGAILLIGLFAVLCWRGLRVAMMVLDAFGSLLATGIVCIIAIQTIINIAVVSGAIPATGLPLPFISAGGSSLAIFMTSIGILLNISKHIRKV